MMLVGRMSAQVPMNMSITGMMMTFYRSTPAVIFWQWTNQSFNALVNYTNRSGSSPIGTNQLLTSYCLATSGALVTALGLNRLVKVLLICLALLIPDCICSVINDIHSMHIFLPHQQFGFPINRIPTPWSEN